MMSLLSPDFSTVLSLGSISKTKSPSQLSTDLRADKRLYVEECSYVLAHKLMDLQKVKRRQL